MSSIGFIFIIFAKAIHLSYPDFYIISFEVLCAIAMTSLLIGYTYQFLKICDKEKEDKLDTKSEN
tara:strand:+ start:473 stop:667 length:195 start_codon:yes stop_codon:yes gene_type:complete